MNISGFDKALRRYTLVGLTGVFLVVGGLGAWAGMAEINGAVIAPGQLVVEGELRHVQHREGGVVNKIHVRSGDRVENGQALIELDTLDLSTELTLVSQQRLEWMARRARLMAQRDDQETVAFPDELMKSENPEIRELIRAQERIFSVQKAGLESRTAQLIERIKQAGEQNGSADRADQTARRGDQGSRSAADCQRQAVQDRDRRSGGRRTAAEEGPCPEAAGFAGPQHGCPT